MGAVGLSEESDRWNGTLTIPGLEESRYRLIASPTISTATWIFGHPRSAREQAIGLEVEGGGNDQGISEAELGAVPGRLAALRAISRVAGWTRMGGRVRSSTASVYVSSPPTRPCRLHAISAIEWSPAATSITNV